MSSASLLHYQAPAVPQPAPQPSQYSPQSSPQIRHSQRNSSPDGYSQRTHNRRHSISGAQLYNDAQLYSDAQLYNDDCLHPNRGRWGNSRQELGSVRVSQSRSPVRAGTIRWPTIETVEEGYEQRHFNPLRAPVPEMVELEEEERRRMWRRSYTFATPGGSPALSEEEWASTAKSRSTSPSSIGSRGSSRSSERRVMFGTSTIHIIH